MEQTLSKLRNTKAVNLLLAAILVIGLLPTLTLANAEKAYADTVSGMAYVYCVNPGITNNDGNLFDVTMPDGQVIRGHCIDYGHNFPADGSYPFTGIWNGSSYDIIVDSTGAPRHPVCIGNVYPCQRVGNFTWSPTGAIDLDKDSANPSISDGNSCYSLAGAEYTVFRNAACTDAWFTMTTDENGYWRTGDDIPANRTYYVKETKAAPGYSLDGTVYPVTVQSNQTARVNGNKVYDTPLNDPDRWTIQKVDTDNAKVDSADAQGNATLGGAEFTVKFYATDDENNLPSTATRTWVIKTDKNGVTSLARAEADPNTYFVSGDAFYMQPTGSGYTLPLGILTVQETKAPVVIF